MTLERRLAYREPLDAGALIGFLAARSVPGVEHVEGGSYTRTLSLPRGGGAVELTPADGAVRCRLRLDDPHDLDAAVASCRRLLDLDAEPDEVAAALEPDPLLGPLVRARPGARVPGCVDGFELAARAVVGQQVSVAGARTSLGRLAAAHGEVTVDPPGRRFPRPEALAAVEPATLPFPRVRGEALRELARLVLDERLDLQPGADPQAARAGLLGIRGIGPWTAAYVAMRALGDRDAWLPGDVGLRNALVRLGAPAGEREAQQLAERWRPWRSYAVMYLWGTL